VPIFQVLAGELSAANELTIVEEKRARAPVRKVFVHGKSTSAGEIRFSAVAARSSRLFALVLGGIRRGRSAGHVSHPDHRLCVCRLLATRPSGRCTSNCSPRLARASAASLQAVMQAHRVPSPRMRQRVFLGWRAARRGTKSWPATQGGRPLWGHHHGPQLSGVRSLAADDEIVFVLADADGTKLLPARCCDLARHSHGKAARRTTSRLRRSGAMTKRRSIMPTGSRRTTGRLYVTFGVEQFVRCAR
jgi:hypothetical protein